jgi:hypothetical protein
MVHHNGVTLGRMIPASLTFTTIHCKHDTAANATYIKNKRLKLSITIIQTLWSLRMIPIITNPFWIRVLY